MQEIQTDFQPFMVQVHDDEHPENSVVLRVTRDAYGVLVQLMNEHGASGPTAAFEYYDGQVQVLAWENIETDDNPIVMHTFKE